MLRPLSVNSKMVFIIGLLTTLSHNSAFTRTVAVDFVDAFLGLAILVIAFFGATAAVSGAAFFVIFSP